jgi:predicted permease
MMRLRPDVGEAKEGARAQAELDVVLRSVAKASVSKSKDWDLFHLVMMPGERGIDYLHGTYAGPSYVLMGLAGLVLLLACVNLANLLLARAAARQREMSTRMALGAGRMRILRQVLTESLLLSGMGGIVGLVLGYAGRNLIPFMLAGRDVPMAVDFDWRVMAFTVAVAMMTGVLFGVAPAWRAVRADVNASLKDGSAAMGGRRGAYLGKGLVVVQIALSTILLMGAGLFARTLENLNHTKLGFEANHLLLFRLNPSRIRYDDGRTMALYGRIEARLAALPGVRSVAMSNIAIMGDGNSGSTFHVTGTPQAHEPVRVQSNSVSGGVSADFFQTMGIPLVEGRGFTTRDTAASPKVAVVNQALARRFFPKGDAVGRTFEADPEDIEGPVTIVGIAADTRYDDLRTATPPTFYIDYKQQVNAGRRVVEIRTLAEPGSVLKEVRGAIAAEDRDLPLIDVRTMTEQVATTVAQERVFAQLTSGFGVLALVLASIGIYGIMAYTVAARTSEIGIRMALGAQAERVLGMVLREVSWMALVGVVLGLGGALMLARLVSAMLYGVSAFDPLTLVGVAVVLMGISLLAGFGPARRASRIDPVRALRHE